MNAQQVPPRGDSHSSHSKSRGNFGQLALHLYPPAYINTPPINYNRCVSVEFILNFAWLVLSASLALLWLCGLRNPSAREQHPDRRVQLLALVMLFVILLPVISMTDDMQAMSTAEIEHVTRRVDLLPSTDQPADLISPLHAELFPGKHLCNLQTFARIEPSIQRARPQTGTIRQMANRPPPFEA